MKLRKYRFQRETAQEPLGVVEERYKAKFCSKNDGKRGCKV